MAAQVGVRDYLRSRGYKDEEIDWNPQTQQVTLQGRNLLQATPQADSKTYSTAADLDRALSTYRGSQLQDQTFSTLSSLSNRLSQSAQQPFQFQAPAPFQYNPNADPAYQAALQTARQNITQQQADTNARLRASGQGRSSYSEQVANQIGAKEMGRVTTEVLPQTMAQAYRQYVDDASRNFQIQQANYGVGQDTQRNLQALLGLMSGLSQQQLDNAFRADQAAADNQFRQSQAEEAARQGRISLAQWLTQTYGVNATPKMDAGVAFDQVAELTPLAMLKYQDDARRYDADYALRKLAQEHGMSMDQAQLALSQFNAQTSRMGAQTSAANQGLSQRRYDDEQRNQERSREYASQVYAGLSEFTSPQEALGWLQANAGDIAANLGSDEYNNIIRNLNSFYGMDTSADRQDATLRQRAIELAQRDPRADFSKSAGKTVDMNVLIDEYMKMLRGG